MSAVIGHDPFTEITGLTADDTWNVKDISGLIQSNTTAVVCLIARDQDPWVSTNYQNGIIHPDWIGHAEQVRWQDGTNNATFGGTTMNSRSFIQIAGVDGSGNLGYILDGAAGANVKIYIVAELGPEWVMFDSVKQIALTSAWADYDLTLDFGADAGNVACAIIRTSNQNNNGVRPNGDTWNPVNMSGEFSQDFMVAVDENDIVEMKGTVPKFGADYAYLMGYVPNGCGIHGISPYDDRELDFTDDGTWRDYSLTNVHATAKWVFWNIGKDVSSDMMFREKGSAEGSTGRWQGGNRSFARCSMVGDSNQEVQYIVGASDFEGGFNASAYWDGQGGATGGGLVHRRKPF